VNSENSKKYIYVGSAGKGKLSEINVNKNSFLKNLIGKKPEHTGSFLM
jgi:hypothetical protein